jgi:hypothetical protein
LSQLFIILGNDFHLAGSFPFKTTRRALRPSRLLLFEETEFGEKGRTWQFVVGFGSEHPADCSQQSQ